jgi:hypothetical protein
MLLSSPSCGNFGQDYLEIRLVKNLPIEQISNMTKERYEENRDRILKTISGDPSRTSGCNCSWDYVTGESPDYFCGKCGKPMQK